tara:strand:- start:4915 stop:5658 length:744 start_codon:yes stop_codon:yes gene_type:complete
MLKIINKKTKLVKPDAVLFDTDNTLYEYSPANNKAIKEVAIKMKNLIGISENKFIEKYSQAKKEIKQQLGNTASSHSRLLYFQRLIELIGLKAQLLLALDLEQTFWRTFLDNAPLFPGVKDLFYVLKKEDIPIGIVTDLTSHIQLRKLTYFGLEDVFDAVVTSEEVGADKPDKKIFFLILKKLKLSTKDNIWMIGDNPYADIYGAKQINALTFQKIHKGVEQGRDEKSPDIIFDNFNHLIRYFKSCI